MIVSLRETKPEKKINKEEENRDNVKPVSSSAKAYGKMHHSWFLIRSILGTIMISRKTYAKE